MPLIRSITENADGWTIQPTFGAAFTVSSADLTTAQKAMTPAQVEALANPLIASRLPAGHFGAVHLTSVVPLNGKLAVSIFPLSANWWALP